MVRSQASTAASRLGGRWPPSGRKQLVLAAMLSLLLGGCHDEHPLYGPDTPRDGAGTPVDPIYGTPIPGAPQGNAGM